MKNVFNPLLASWFQALSGNVNVPVYRADAPPEIKDYVVIRAESETTVTNNRDFVSVPVVITEVVTRFGSGELASDDQAQQIDSLISQIILPTPQTIGISQPAGLQVTRIDKLNTTTLVEDDGAHRYFRVITRYSNRVKQ